MFQIPGAGKLWQALTGSGANTATLVPARSGTNTAANFGITSSYPQPSPPAFSVDQILQQVWPQPWYGSGDLDPIDGGAPENRACYLALYKKEPRLNAAIEGKVGSIASLKVSVRGADEDNPVDVDAASFIDSCIRQSQHGSWISLLASILRPGLVYGWSAGEITLSELTTGKYRGKWGLKHVRNLNTEPFIKLQLDVFRNITGVVNLIRGIQDYDPRKFVFYVNKPIFGNPFGQSDVQPAQRAALMFREVYQVWYVALKQFGLPYMHGKVGNANHRKALEDAMDAIRGGGWAVTGKEDEILVLDLAASAAANGFEAMVDKLSEDIFFAVRGSSTPSQVSSNKGGDNRGNTETSKQTGQDPIEKLAAEDLIHCINRHLIPRLMEPNYPPSVGMPYLTIGESDEEDTERKLKVIAIVENELKRPVSTEEIYKLSGTKPADPADPDDAKVIQRLGAEGQQAAMTPGGGMPGTHGGAGPMPPSGPQPPSPPDGGPGKPPKPLPPGPGGASAKPANLPVKENSLANASVQPRDGVSGGPVPLPVAGGGDVRNGPGVPQSTPSLTSGAPSAAPSPTPPPVAAGASSPVPAELTVAILEAAAEGDWKAVDDLTELGADPEGLAELLADRDAGTYGAMSTRAFSAMRTFSALGQPVAAGLAVRAADTGRVLILQRGFEEGDHASHKWEFPGGHLRRGESSEAAAKREWCEETGSPWPKGTHLGSWVSRNGVYTGHIWEVPTEDAVKIGTEGDRGERIAWVDPTTLAVRSDVRDELKAEMRRVLPVLDGLRTFSAFAALRCFSWFSDPTARSRSRITNSDNGAHAYGDTARRIMEAQGRTERGEEHPETPKQMLVRRKQEAEPAREEARAAYQKALQDPGSLTSADLTALRDHLHTLPRDEIRKNLREVMYRTGGKLKAELVDGLLSHVRQNAVQHHEAKLDPLSMDMDQDIAAKAIQDLQGESLPRKSSRDQDAEAAHLAGNDHNKRREQRHDLMQSVESEGDKTTHGTPDQGSKLKQPDKMLDVRTLEKGNVGDLTLADQVKKPEPVKEEPKPEEPSRPSIAAHNQKPTYTTDKPEVGATVTPEKQSHELTAKEYQTSGAANFGDMVQAGGIVGTMQGSGGLGSGRVTITDANGQQHHVERGDVKLIRRQGVGSADKPPQLTEAYKQGIKNDIRKLEDEHGELLFKKRFADGLKKRLESGSISQEQFDKATAANPLTPEESTLAAEVEAKIEAVKNRPFEWDQSDDVHRMAVENALAAGKPVPPEVLADYPDLAKPKQAAPDATPATSDTPLSPTPRSTPLSPAGGEAGQPEGANLETIGRGSTGEVKRRGDFVYKKATGNEGKVYKELLGVPGIAPGREEGGEIVTPHYPNIVSVDAVPAKQRKTLGAVIKPNLPDLVNAVTALSEAGYDYSDPIQVGFDKGRKAHLFDFSAATKTSEQDATRENLNRLSTYLNQFGLERHGKAISRVGQVLDYIDPDSRALDSESPEALDGERVHAQLDGKPPKYAYYGFNARTIPGVAQTENRDGVTVVFSPEPLDEKFISQWELNPAVHRSDANSSRFKAFSAASDEWSLLKSELEAAPVVYDAPAG